MTMHIATRRALLTPEAAASGSEWSPTDLTDLVAWWDGSDETTLYTDAGSTQVSSDGDPVYQVNDKSANNNHQVQATEADRPLYKTGIQNSNSILRFGNSDFLRSTFSLIQPYTLFVVWWDDSITDSGQLIGGVTSNVAFYFSSTTTLRLYAGGAGPTKNISSSTWTISGSIWDAASSKQYINGGTAATGDPGTTAPGGLTICGTYDGDSITADIAEIVVCDAVLSTADLNSLGNYLGTKWDITWSDVS